MLDTDAPERRVTVPWIRVPELSAINASDGAEFAALYPSCFPWGRRCCFSC